LAIIPVQQAMLVYYQQEQPDRTCQLPNTRQEGCSRATTRPAPSILELCRILNNTFQGCHFYCAITTHHNAMQSRNYFRQRL